MSALVQIDDWPRRAQARTIDKQHIAEPTKTEKTHSGFGYNFRDASTEAVCLASRQGHPILAQRQSSYNKSMGSRTQFRLNRGIFHTATVGLFHLGDRLK
jgi:hypothetical protein